MSSYCPCSSCRLNKTEPMPDSQPLAILHSPIFSLSLKPIPSRHIYLLPNHVLTWLSPGWSTLDYLMGHSLCFCCRENPVPTPLLHSPRSSHLDQHQLWFSCSETFYFVLYLQSKWCLWPSGICPHLIPQWAFNVPAGENTSSVAYGLVLLKFFGPKTVYIIKWANTHDEYSGLVYACFFIRHRCLRTVFPSPVLCPPKQTSHCFVDTSLSICCCSKVYQNLPILPASLKHHDLQNPFPDSTLLTYPASFCILSPSP